MAGAVRRRGAVLLMGPTGAGKSTLAVELAQDFPFEIISVDSALVFCGMDIGTAKPTPEERRGIAHHLIDIRDVAGNYSAGEFVRDAALLMEDIWRRGSVPLLVGGTMLYFTALTEGIAVLPEGDAAVRAAIEQQAARDGWPAVHRELAAVDPTAAVRISVNDCQRIQRALEVFKLTGEPISRLQLDRKSVLDGVEIVEFAVTPADRGDLHARIGRRFDTMMQKGFLKEVQKFFERTDLTAEHTSMRAVGYRQLWRYLAGACALKEAEQAAVTATRQLAKRQMTWLRRRHRAQWLDSMHPAVALRLKTALSRGKSEEWL